MEKKGWRNLSREIRSGVQSADGTPSFTLLEDIREVKEKEKKKKKKVLEKMDTQPWSFPSPLMRGFPRKPSLPPTKKKKKYQGQSKGSDCEFIWSF